MEQTQTNKIPCTIEILTLNSAQTLPRLLESIKGFAEVIVLDGGSTDGTVDLAATAGCRIIAQNDFQKPDSFITDFAFVRNRGLDAATYSWFLFIDSDEYLSPEAVVEIDKITKRQAPECMVYEVPRKYVMGGQVIEYSITYPAVQTRFFNRNAVTKFIKPVHERIEVRQGIKVGRLKNPIYVPQSEKFFPRKWFKYMEIEAAKYKNFSMGRCLIITARRLAISLLYTWRYIFLLLSNKKPRAPWRHEVSYIVYNFVHIFYMWRARLGKSFYKID